MAHKIKLYEYADKIIEKIYSEKVQVKLKKIFCKWQEAAIEQKFHLISIDDCQAITTDSVRHIVKWKGSGDSQLIQARPIKLRFYLEKAKLYSFAPRIKYKHYIPSYDG